MQATDLNCPDCLAVNWTRDGFAVRRHPDGSIERQRLGPSGMALDDRWHCASCGAVVDDRSPAEIELRTIQYAHVD